MADPMSDPVLAAQYRLTSRDLVLLGWLAEHKTLTTAQIAQALFPSPRVAQERLLKLTRAGIVDRFRPFKDVGTNPFHYVLTQLGEEITAGQHSADDRETWPRRDAARRRRQQLANRVNLPHLLAVNQFFVDLAGYARTHPGCRLERWWSSARCQRPGAFSGLWPEGAGIAQLYDATVAADGHGIWAATAPAVGGWSLVPFFLEVDLGTEDQGRLTEKLLAYQRFTAATGYTWPVLFWFASSVRERNFHAHLDATTPGLAGRSGPPGLAGTVATVPVATAAADRTWRDGLSPAEDVWWLHAQPHDRPGTTDQLLDLSDLERTLLRPHFDAFPHFQPQFGRHMEE